MPICDSRGQEITLDAEVMTPVGQGKVITLLEGFAGNHLIGVEVDGAQHVVRPAETTLAVEVAIEIEPVPASEPEVVAEPESTPTDAPVAQPEPSPEE